MLDKLVQAGETVYIPGGGVGHLAVQMAARVLGAGLVISSGSTLQSTALTRQSGAHYVFASVIELDESNVAGDDRVPLFSVAAPCCAFRVYTINSLEGAVRQKWILGCKYARRSTFLGPGSSIILLRVLKCSARRSRGYIFTWDLSKNRRF